MKQVINKKLYDTEKSTLIAEWTNGLGRSDFQAIEERIYQTKNGGNFLEYWGGAATKYQEIHNGYSSEGRGIIPISEARVYDWLEEKGMTEKILKLFPSWIEEA